MPADVALGLAVLQRVVAEYVRLDLGDVVPARTDRNVVVAVCVPPVSVVLERYVHVPELPVRSLSDVQVVPSFGVACKNNVPFANTLFWFVTSALNDAKVPAPPPTTARIPARIRNFRYVFD